MKFVKSILLIIAFISIVGFLILSLIKTTPQAAAPEQQEAEEEKPKSPVKEKYNASASAVSDAVIVEENPIQ